MSENEKKEPVVERPSEQEENHGDASAENALAGKTEEAANAERIQEAGDPAAEWRDKYLRTLAELDNFSKRMERERKQHRLYACEALMRDLLPVLDDLKLACESEGDADAIREGVSLALKSALNALGSNGLEVISALGEPFDPRWHEAIGTIPNTDKKPGTIVIELCRGYRLHDRVLRPSRVQIAMEPAAGEGNAGTQPNNED